ncbi:unnamed protein product, partial [marine sediment metagenome]
MATFAERKREARKILKRAPLTQAELAREMKVSRAYSKLILGGLMEDGAVVPVRERSIVYYAYSFRVPLWIRPILWISGCAAATSVFFPPAALYAVSFAGGGWAIALWKELVRRMRLTPTKRKKGRT